jgi:hypothetical protein
MIPSAAPSTSNYVRDTIIFLIHPPSGTERRAKPRKYRL